MFRFILKIIRNIFYFCVAIGIFGIIIAWIYAKKLEHDYQLDSQDLSGALWTMPARVFARPLEIYEGAELSKEELIEELKLIGYHQVTSAIKPEQYEVSENSVIYYATEFAFWDQKRPIRRMEVQFEDGKVKSVENLSSLEKVAMERLNPLRIANIYPQHREDRVLVKYDEIPPVLIDAIIATEDRNFYIHPGIDPRGIFRSIYVTFIAKGNQQGASTITQQFIKNHYLTNEHKYSRKIKEMLMALVLERHTSKQKILEGYINEIYLGQDGQRAIHGFGLASEYFFNKPLDELNLHQIATLVALVREPGNADPRKKPEKALERRNLMLRVMREQNLITAEDEKLAASLPLDVVPVEQTRDRIRFPHFVDLVMRQLGQDYKTEDLTKQGLNIYTTLNPQVQAKVQKSLTAELGKLEKSKGLKSRFLQGAGVIVDVNRAEVVALIGSRNAEELGFNRAISAQRHIGSLVKPPIYLAALEYPNRYNLYTRIDDSPFTYKGWSPQNYGRNFHGKVTLLDALVHSYNIPAVRVALDLGLRDVVGTLERLGAHTGIPLHPAISLGAIEMTPLEVAQIYETFASGGYYNPLRAIREITTVDGEIVKRFDVQGVRAIEPSTHYLISYALQEIPRRGTAKAVYNHFDKELNIAGKTGTSNNYKDSWFAGYTGNYLAVAWVGNDQNKPTKLSGGQGGLPLWIAMMQNLPLKPLEVPEPGSIVTTSCNGNKMAPHIATYYGCEQPQEQYESYSNGDEMFYGESFELSSLPDNQGDSFYQQQQGQNADFGSGVEFVSNEWQQAAQQNNPQAWNDANAPQAYGQAGYEENYQQAAPQTDAAYQAPPAAQNSYDDYQQQAPQPDIDSGTRFGNGENESDWGW